METKGKKRLWNMIMVLLIMVIAASGVLTVGKIRGWFDRPEEIYVTSGQTRGVVNIQRNGIGYTLSADSALQSGDLIETRKGGQAELVWKDQEKLTLNEKTGLTAIRKTQNFRCLRERCSATCSSKREHLM